MAEEVVWSFTPRKMHALLFIGSKRRDQERFEDLWVHFLASQGDPKAVQRQLQSMERNL
jgi:hypothetical protein